MSDLAQGREQLQKALSYTKTSVLSLRFSPEWESVQRHARRALESFKIVGPSCWKELLQAYDLAIEAFEHTGSYQQCGVYADEAGDLAFQVADDTPTPAELYQKAINYFISAAKYCRLQGNADKNVGIQLKASQCYFKIGNVPKAISLARAACECYENDHKLIGAEKYLTQVLQMIISIPDWEQVVEWLRYMTKVLGKRRDMYANNIFHYYLGEVVIYLYLGQYTTAFERMEYYRDNDDDFMKTEQYAASRALIAACNTNDEEAIPKARKDWPILKYQEREIALLVPKLKLNPEYHGYNVADKDSVDEPIEIKDTAASLAQDQL